MKTPVNVKLAQRFVRFLSRKRERIEERETGMADFIIRCGIFAMPVRLRFASSRFLLPPRLTSGVQHAAATTL
ncbi:MAG: hypothetical protein WC091_00940 [Sulfuricellaceae bacterium]